MNERLSLPAPAGEKPKVEAALMGVLLRLLLMSHPVDLLIPPRMSTALALVLFLHLLNELCCSNGEKQPQTTET